MYEHAPTKYANGGTTGRHAPREACPRALVGSDPAFLKVLHALPALARADHTVLVSGETGTGKELVARTLHDLSSRSKSAFVPVNCGALPDTLFEDELFGHERGAFTDARARREGLILRARGGTLFLDEVDSLSPRGQVALLRVLQDGTFRPLGADAERTIDVRFVAATNAPLLKLVDSGAFRPDLYFRLNVLPLALPPLRERRSDILPLAYFFLHRHAPDGWTQRELPPDAIAALLAHDWPGNVRELESVIIRALHMTPGGASRPGDFRIVLPHRNGDSAEAPCYDGPRKLQELKRDVVAAFERDYLRRLMTRYDGNVTHAARAAGKERRALGRLLSRHHICPDEFSD